MDYTHKTYGRNAEINAIYKLFDAGLDISMPGPRRLGKTFLLDRLVDQGPAHNWMSIKIEVAGCKNSKEFFRQLCEKIGNHRNDGEKVISWLSQRLGQAFDPRTESTGPWYQPFLSLDHESYFEKLIKTLNDDKNRRWALLIDELPIFLKALHDTGPAGIDTARNFMNFMSRLKVDYPKVRWLITGSIGLEPLAEVGNYMGVLAKFRTFTLSTLTIEQASDFLIDLASTGRLIERNSITRAEAAQIIIKVGWRSPFYLEALANKLKDSPTEHEEEAKVRLEEALKDLIQPNEAPTFGVWEEHLQKHYAMGDRAIATKALNKLARHPEGTNFNELLSAVNQLGLQQETLRKILIRLHTEGFILVDNWDSENPTATIQNLLLREWWRRFPLAPRS
jgi:uncharacterized protein